MLLMFSLFTCSQKEFVGPANGTLQDIHAYARGKT